MAKKDETKFDVVVEYLFVEGYTDTIESAEIMAESISEQWIDNILESRGGDLRLKHGITKPGQASETLAKIAKTKALNIGRRTHFDRERGDNLLRLSGRARDRSEGETSVGLRTNPEGQLRDIRSRGGRPPNNYNDGENRDRGDYNSKADRLRDFVMGKRDNPNMTDSERRSAHNNRKPKP